MNMRQATAPSAEAAGGQCAVTIDYEAKLLQGSSSNNASSVPFVGSLNIQNTSPAVRAALATCRSEHALRYAAYSRFHRSCSA